MNMTPEEFVKLSNEYQEMTSICDGLKYDFIESILKKKYMWAKLSVYKLQQKMKDGKQFCFKWYGNTIIINQIVSALNPLIKVRIDEINVQTAELFNAEVKVEFIDKYGNKQWRDIPINGICEYIDPQNIDPNEYEF